MSKGIDVCIRQHRNGFVMESEGLKLYFISASAVIFHLEELGCEEPGASNLLKEAMISGSVEFIVYLKEAAS